MTKFPVPAKDQEDLARMMFIFHHIIKESLGKTRSHSVSELYQDLLKTRYCQYRERLEQDKIRLQEDICILRGVERNHPAPVSGPSATGVAES